MCQENTSNSPFNRLSGNSPGTTAETKFHCLFSLLGGTANQVPHKMHDASLLAAVQMQMFNRAAKIMLGDVKRCQQITGRNKLFFCCIFFI